MEMKFDKIYRHGDVIIFRLPEGAIKDDSQKLKKTSKITLALGESTGHAHVLEGNLEISEESSNSENELYFKVIDKAVLYHQEHDVMLLEKGNYLKVNQVEYDPFTELIRYVRD
jgi:hypothetical protein